MTAAERDRIVNGYHQAAEKIAERYDAIDPTHHANPAFGCLPTDPSHVLDVGAGTGRVAAWLCAQGHRVTAIEPADGLRTFGMARRGGQPIRWLDGALPELTPLGNGNNAFDAVIMIGVWHHVPTDMRASAIQRLGSLLVPGGRILASLRHGPTAPDRPGFPASADEMSDLAERQGIRCIYRAEAPSIQPGNKKRGVTWTWWVGETST
ncbi:MAG: class I SAM-dependent methyltransferase [Pseudomonadota bacterium]